MERKNSYVYGSVAPRLSQQPEICNVPRKVNKPLPTSTSIPKVQMVFCVIFMVAVSFVILYRYALISELNYRMGMLTEEYNELKDENRKLKVDIETSINLDYVKEFAETRLNMHKPDNYQIVLVDVPKNDYSVVVNQSYIDETTRKTSLVERLMNLVKAILPGSL